MAILCFVYAVGLCWVPAELRLRRWLLLLAALNALAAVLMIAERWRFAFSLMPYGLDQ